MSPPLAPVVLDRVSFVVAGTQKGGTQSLDRYLRAHPELCLPPLGPVGTRLTGEVHFFDNDARFAKEPVDYAHYHAKFRPRPPQRLLGEVTPVYLYWPTAAERMVRYNAALKIIVSLRNPITRAFSHWNMTRDDGQEPLAFLEALRAEAERTNSLPLQRARRFAYVARGRYAEQLQRLWQHFPPTQTMIFRSEELQRDPRAVLARIATFLGLAPFPSMAERSEHAREYPAPMSAEEKRYLAGVFEGEIRQLERLLDWDCSDWLA
jgi:Sulfotransferase domain